MASVSANLVKGKHIGEDEVVGEPPKAIATGKNFGNARHVFSRGEWVVKDAQWIGETGRGRFLKREANAGGFA